MRSVSAAANVSFQRQKQTRIHLGRRIIVKTGTAPAIALNTLINNHRVYHPRSYFLYLTQTDVHVKHIMQDQSQLLYFGLVGGPSVPQNSKSYFRVLSVPVVELFQMSVK